MSASSSTRDMDVRHKMSSNESSKAKQYSIDRELITPPTYSPGIHYSPKAEYQKLIRSKNRDLSSHLKLKLNLICFFCSPGLSSNPTPLPSEISGLSLRLPFIHESVADTFTSGMERDWALLVSWLSREVGSL